MRRRTDTHTGVRDQYTFRVVCDSREMQKSTKMPAPVFYKVTRNDD